MQHDRARPIPVVRLLFGLPCSACPWPRMASTAGLSSTLTRSLPLACIAKSPRFRQHCSKGASRAIRHQAHAGVCCCFATWAERLIASRPDGTSSFSGQCQLILPTSLPHQAGLVHNGLQHSSAGYSSLDPMGPCLNLSKPSRSPKRQGPPCVPDILATTRQVLQLIQTAEHCSQSSSKGTKSVRLQTFIRTALSHGDG